MEKELNCNVLKLSPKEQEELRKKIVRQMKKHGDTKEVAEICECSLRHVQSTWKKYQKGGIKAILAVKMGSPIGENRKLTSAQEEVIKNMITEKSPVEAGLIGHLWGRAEVSELVKRQFGIEMPLSTIGDYLARWNFTYQRPKKRITGKTPKP
jgi:transposase